MTSVTGATRVLVVRLSSMGDVVQGTGAVRALHAARPDVEIGWVVQRPFAPLVGLLPGVAVVIPHDRHAGVRGYLRTARELRGFEPQVALDLQGNWKSAGFAWLSGAAVRVGVAGPARPEPSSAWLLNQRVGVGSVRHPALQALAVVRAVAPGAPERAPALDADGEETAREAAVLEGLGIDPRAPFRILVLGDARDPRSIRPAALDREARGSPYPCVAVAGPDEATTAPPTGVPCVRHAPGSVRRLVALGALAAAAGGDAVGPDKGATHVLAAAGAPTTVLFGPTDPARTGPPGARALRSASSPDCAPCRSRTCRRADGPVCMDVSTAEGRPID